jgi:predicted RNase H-like nuclease (RuvC/YqgF family)
MPSIDFEVYCGRCGEGICKYTNVSGTEITVECPRCAKEIEKLEDELTEHEDTIEKLEAAITKLKADVEYWMDRDDEVDP